MAVNGQELIKNFTDVVEQANKMLEQGGNLTSYRDRYGNSGDELFLEDLETYKSLKMKLDVALDEDSLFELDSLAEEALFETMYESGVKTS